MPATNHKLPLHGQSVLVTRPQEKNQVLAAKLQELGAIALNLPGIEIVALDIQTALKSLPFDIATTDIIIFVSINAVRYGMLEHTEISAKLPSSVQFAAIGAASCEQLMRADISAVITPSKQYDSAGLLQLDEFQQVKDNNILIIKGTGGRTEIAETLTQREANVANLDVYQRQVPSLTNPSALAETIDASLFSSCESVDNILSITPESFHSVLFNSQVIAGHQRIAEKVTSLGFKKLPIIAANPTDAAMLAALVKWTNTTEIKDER